MKLKSILKNKKGAFSLGDMTPIVMAIIVAGITIGIAAYVIASSGEAVMLAGISAHSYTNDTGVDDVFNGTRDSMSSFADWLPIVVVVSAAAIILGVIGVAFTFGRSR